MASHYGGEPHYAGRSQSMARVGQGPCNRALRAQGYVSLLSTTTLTITCRHMHTHPPTPTHPPTHTERETR